MSGRRFGSVRRLPSGRSQARYTDRDGERHTAEQLFETKRDAYRHLATIQADIERGSWIHPDAGRITLEEYARSWLEARATLRPRTRELYDGQLRNHIISALGDIDLADLTPPLIRRWYADLVRKPSLAPITAGLPP